MVKELHSVTAVSLNKDLCALLTWYFLLHLKTSQLNVLLVVFNYFFPYFFNNCYIALHSQTSLKLSVLSVTWVLRSAVHTKDIFWCPALTLVQSGERIPEMYFRFTTKRRDSETNITDQTRLSVLAVRKWSYLILILIKRKSLTVP